MLMHLRNVDERRGALRRLRRALMAGLLTLCAGAAGAATIHVTTAADGAPTDDGQCTLREAVLLAREFAANDDCGAPSGADDEIVFDVASVNLTQGGMQFTTNVKLTGPVTINGAGNAGERLFLFASAGHLTLANVTLQGFNAATTSGGVITADFGDLTIDNCAFNNNHTNGDGGAIWFGGDSLIVTNSTFTGNQAQFDGGAMRFNPDVTVQISTTTFTNNTAGRDGGALYIAGVGALADVTLTTVTFNSNTANGDGTSEVRGGGAIFNDGGDTSGSLILIQDTVFNLNQAPSGRGGALLNAPTAAISWPDTINSPDDLHAGGLFNCLFFQNTAGGSGGGGVNGLGGAIYNGGQLSVLGSTFDQNRSLLSGGGAIAHLKSFGLENDRLRVANSTFSGNQAASDGGAISSFSASAKLLLLNSTLSGNLAGGSGGALYNANSAPDAGQVGNLILANSPSGGNCGGEALADLGGNLQFPGSTCGASIQTGNPQLAALAPNPPPIKPTMALGATSAALGLGNPAICSAAPIFNLDQRLLPRPQGGGNCDAGAFESPSPAPQPGYGSNPTPGSILAAIDTTVNVAGTRTFTVSETGSAQLNVTAVSISGGPVLTIAPGSFSIPDGGAAVTVTITCQSAATGTFDGTVTVQHNAAGSPATYTVQCQVNPAPAPGYGSAPAPGNPLLPITTTTNVIGTSTLLVSETGNALLDVTSVALQAGSAPELSVSPASFQIPDGGVSVPVTVQCLSASTGTFLGTVRVQHNAAGSPATYAVSCTVGALAVPGYGSKPAPGNALAPIDTVTGVVGTSTFSVAETGNALLDVGSVALLAGSAPELSVSPPSFQIADGAPPVTVTVSCLSASTGTFNGTVRVLHNAAGSPATYTVTCSVGPANAPGYGSTPSPGSTLAPLSTTPAVAATRAFTVSETGNAALVVGSVTVVGAPELTVGPSSFTIGDGQPAVTVTVTCQSAALGVFAGTVTVAHNAAGSPAQYPVSCRVHPLGTRGDLNQDQVPDIVFRSQTTGTLAVWMMAGVNIVQQTTTNPPALTDLNWKLQGTADLDGNGHTDLLWRHATSGKNVVWLMNQTTRIGGVFLNPDTLAGSSWQIAGTGHFNADGKPDLLWRNSASGRNVVWTMDGVNRLLGQFTTPDTQPVEWQVAGTGDFNGDEQTDILWQRVTDGFMTVWYMNGLVRTGQADITPQLAPTAQGGWRISAVEDYDGNGRPDLVFRNVQSGRIAIWFMDASGVNRLLGAFTSPQNLPPLDQKIVGPR